MVDAKKVKNGPSHPTEVLHRFSSSVFLREILGNACRLEAAAFGIEARTAVEAMQQKGLSLVPLYGEQGVCNEAHNAFRFRRIYVDEGHGVPFLSSSDIINMRPNSGAFLSRKLTKNLNRLLVKEWDVLISCSGTVGNVALAGRRMEGYALSQHAIRVRSEQPDIAGFVTAFLRSKLGRPQLTGASYGSVVVHIEPEHLARVWIPKTHPITESSIGLLMREACEMRDKANKLIDDADKLLRERLKLPRLADLGRKIKQLGNAVSIRNLNGRLDGSYHDPLAELAAEKVRKTCKDVTTVGNPAVSKEIRPITKFRKRVYVERGGIPMLNSKQILQVDPVDIKRLAKGAHTKDLPEIMLEKNTILITRSGTIGRVQIVPPYMQGWTASEDATRIFAAEGMNAGYLFAWLSSDYGSKLLARHSYGSVILKIDKDMIASVPFPLADENTREEIGSLVLNANNLRDEAWRKEQQAIGQVEALVS